MRIFAIGFLVGICSIFYFNHAPELAWIIILAGLFSVIGIIIIKKYQYNLLRLLGFLILGSALGFAWIMLNAKHQLNNILPVELESKSIALEGDIVSLPEYKSHGISFLFKTNSVLNKNNLIKLSWFSKEATPMPRAGERWKLIVRLKRPHGMANPGGFDYEAFLFEHRIHATGYVVSGEKLKNNKKYFIVKFREQLKNKLYFLTRDLSYHEFLPAFILGERDKITPTEWAILQHTGTEHLIAIAGLHIGLIAGLFFWLGKYVWRRFPKLLLKLPAQQAGVYLSFVAAFFYALLAGFSLPTRRAMLMLSVVWLALLMRRKIPLFQNYCLALFLVLLFEPFSVLSSSFWLSFIAVGSILYGLQNSEKLPFWKKWLHLQYALTIGIFPLMILYFSQISFLSPLANLMAVPWFCLFVAPLSFMGSIFLFFYSPLAKLLFYIALKNWQGLFIILTKMDAWKGMFINFSPPNTGWIMLLCVGAFILISPISFRKRLLGLVFFIPLFFNFSNAPKNNYFKLSLLDVGQGLSTVVETANHALVFDTGAKFTPEFDMGKAVVMPFLQIENIKKLDKLVISHGDLDHIGGADSVLNAIKVEQILTSVPKRFLPREAQYCHSGQHWSWDGVDFDILSPEIDKDDGGNNNSCVLKISDGKTSALLTGDIEKKLEKILIQDKINLHADILVAPHHGSNTSSHLAFIKAVSPKITLFPVGYKNKFHFPSISVIRRYQEFGAKLYNTVESGAIMVNSEFEKIQQFRKDHPSIWNA